MLDLDAYRARRWQSWQVLLLSFGVYLFGITAIVYQGAVMSVGRDAMIAAALMASIAVTGLGYQEARELGAYRRPPRRPLRD